MIVTEDSAAPDVGFKLEIVGGPVTVKGTPLLAAPPTAVTTTFPVVAPAGTVAVMLVSLQLLMPPAVPLKLTPPCEDPKFVPEMTTEVPTAPAFGERLVMFGGTVNRTPLLSTPLA